MKKILTLGPTTTDPALLKRALRTADEFRLNASHLDSSSLQKWLETLTRAFEERHIPIPVVLDLQGAKMRVGEYPATPDLPARVELFDGVKSGVPERIPVPHAELFRAVEAGERLLLNDSRVVLKVEGKTASGLSCLVEKNGPVSAHKGINRPRHPVRYTQLTERDREAIAVGMNFPFVHFAFSFVHDATESRLVRPLIGNRRLVAKLELREALHHLGAIDDSFDELWLCRGDLGAQVGLRALGALQEEFVSHIPKLAKPAVLAGQVLEHMTSHPEPTRSEVVHLHDACRQGFQGIVLSDETAVGLHVESVCGFLDDFFGRQGS